VLNAITKYGYELSVRMNDSKNNVRLYKFYGNSFNP